MFIGTFNNSIDDKSRMIVPSKYRKQLDESCVISQGLDKCLYVYTLEGWDEFMTKLKTLPISDKDGRRFVRYFTAYASECSVDKQGRVTIPQKLKKYAGIDKEIVTVGAVSRIELWSQEIWEADNDEIVPSPEDIESAMAKYGI